MNSNGTAVVRFLGIEEEYALNSEMEKKTIVFDGDEVDLSDGFSIAKLMIVSSPIVQFEGK
jgi:hypothetical protein